MKKREYRKKTFAALLLSATMVVSMMPTVVLADTTSAQQALSQATETL